VLPGARPPAASPGPVSWGRHAVPRLAKPCQPVLFAFQEPVPLPCTVWYVPDMLVVPDSVPV